MKNNFDYKQKAEDIRTQLFPEIKQIEYLFINNQKFPVALASPGYKKRSNQIAFNIIRKELYDNFIDIVIHEFTHIVLGVGHNKQFWGEFRRRKQKITIK